mmetsp:Transcript_18447/g.19905  ORF Transcript_18447/g.19905 Transcript_18447/m.19905 type:complete len:348 (+) Transcript_18447:817-1860(+)
MSDTGAWTGENESPTQDHTGLSRTQVHFLDSSGPPVVACCRNVQVPSVIATGRIPSQDDPSSGGLSCDGQKVSVEEGGAAEGGAGAGVVVSSVSHAQVNDAMAVSHTHKILVSVKSLGGVPDCSIYPQPIADLSSGTVPTHEAPSMASFFDEGQPAGIVSLPVPGTTTTGSSVVAGTAGTTDSAGTGAAGSGSTGTTGSAVAGTAGTTTGSVVTGTTGTTTAGTAGAAVVTTDTGVVVGATTIGTGTVVGAGTTGIGTALGGGDDIVPSQVQRSSLAIAQPQVADSLTVTPLVVTVCEKVQEAWASPPWRIPAHEVPSPGKLGGHCVVVSVGGPGVAGTGMDELGSV